MVELVDLVNFVIIFLSQMTLLRWLTFQFRLQTVILIAVVFWIYFFLDTSILFYNDFPPLRNSDHVVVSVFIDFLSYSQWDAPFHCIAYDYSHANWEGLHDHLRDVQWGEDIFKLSVLLLLVNFLGGLRLQLMYLSLVESIRSSHTRLHGFQLLVLLSWFITITFVVCTKRINLLNLK